MGEEERNTLFKGGRKKEHLIVIPIRSERQ
jgi:hypothetical protein